MAAPRWGGQEHLGDRRARAGLLQRCSRAWPRPCRGGALARKSPDARQTGSLGPTGGARHRQGPSPSGGPVRGSGGAADARHGLSAGGRRAGGFRANDGLEPQSGRTGRRLGRDLPGLRDTERPGWHLRLCRSRQLPVPDNVVLLPLPAFAPERNPTENLWQYLRGNYLRHEVYGNYETVVNAGRDAWNALMKLPEVILSIGNRDYAQVNIEGRWYNSSEMPRQGNPRRPSVLAGIDLGQHHRNRRQNVLPDRGVDRPGGAGGRSGSDDRHPQYLPRHAGGSGRRSGCHGCGLRTGGTRP